MIDFDDLAAAETPWNPEDLAARAQRSSRERDRLQEANVQGDKDPCQGAIYGLELPTSLDELEDWGCEWLNKACRAAGTLPPGVEIAAIRALREVCSSSRFVTRAKLEVDYRPSWATLHRELLVKLPAPRPAPPAPDGDKEPFARARAGQALAELSAYRPLQMAEISAYRLLEEAGPLRMPRFYFGDHCEGTSTSILIVEWVRALEVLRKAKQKEDMGGFSLGLQGCRLQGPHGGFLTASSSAQIYLSYSQFDENTLWIIRPSQCDSKRRTLVAEVGLFLDVRDGSEQAQRMVAEERETSTWSLIPCPGEYGKCYLRSLHNTYLASLDDFACTLYMSPNEGPWERWNMLPTELADKDEGHKSQREEDAGGDNCFQPLDLPFATSDSYKLLISAGATMAGMHKAGAFGAPSSLELAFGGSTSKRAARRQGPILGLGKDHDFIEKVTTAQNFIQNVGKSLLPFEVTTSEAMKAFRAVITSARHNLPQIDWWCNCRKDYVSLGLGALELEGLFTVPSNDGGDALGVCDWTSTSVSCLGQKLWHWFSRADHRVLEGRLDDWLALFAETYHQNGGPALDIPLLRLHFVLSAAVELVRLLDDVPQICQTCPSDQWDSIVSFSDKRLSGPVWRVVRVLTNAAVVMTESEIRHELEEVMTRVRIGYLMGAFITGQATPAYFDVGKRGAEVRVGPGEKQLLLCRLPAGMLVCAACESGALRTHECYVRLLIPVPGWARLKDLVATTIPASQQGVTEALREDFGDPCWSSADAMMLTLMYESRRQWTGRSPLHMCATSTRKLLEAIELREEHQQLQTHLGRGACQQVAGSFLAETTAHAWWPRGYQAWCHHVFLRFEDGSIADVTADQWDKDVPQLWWPADKTRYTLTTREADSARELRRFVGMDLWKELDSADTINSVFKTRRRWTELERLQAGADQHVQPDPYTQEDR